MAGWRAQPRRIGFNPLVGREAEIELLTRSVGGRTPEARLVFSGDAGIGKTTLWQVGLELAVQDGCWRVVHTGQ